MIAIGKFITLISKDRAYYKSGKTLVYIAKMELDVSPSNTIENDMEYSDNSSESKYIACNNNEQYSVIRIPEDGEKSSKHSSRKQSKRRKKSSNHSRPLPRIIVKPLPPPPPPENREWTAAASFSEPSSNSSKLSTMREVLASIPGFSIKPRKRSGKKLSTAAQLQQTREGCIDLETPDSILVNTNIRALLNKHTFSLLPTLYQYKLGQLLPSVDRPSTSGRLSSSSLNNEFFARACLEWQDCLSGGEFTPENQQKMKTEAEKEKSKIDPWKLKHFEPFWGEKSRRDKSSINLNSERPSLKTTIKLRPTASITSSSTVPKIKKSKSSSSNKRMRSVGAVTRSSAKADDVLDEPVNVSSKSSAPIPDLLPLKHTKAQNQGYVDCQDNFSFSDSSSVQRLDDSVSTTPVDPLLLPDAEDRTEIKEELDITVVTIEESNASKDCQKEKSIDSDENIPETVKRLSDDPEYYSSAKRIKFEEDYEEDFELDNARFLAHNAEGSVSNNCSDVETNYPNEQICPNDELHIYSEQEHGDTNSEDSKATASVYEFDERSESSMSSFKIESNVNNAVVNEPNTNTNIDTFPSENTPTEAEETTEEIKVENKCSPLETREEYIVEPFQDCVKTDPKTILETTNDNKLPSVSKEVTYQNIEVIEEMECHIAQPTESLDVKNDEVRTEKCEEKSRPAENVQSYYDEHFKDAESFIMETGGLAILTSRKFHINLPFFILYGLCYVEAQ